MHTKQSADERAAEINKNGSGDKARVGFYITNGVEHYPVHVLPGDDSPPYTESGR